MPGKSQIHSDAVLNVLRGISLSGVTPYVGLLSVAPANDAATGTELAGNGYSRQAITFDAPATDSGNVRKIANTSAASFGPAVADWAQAVAFGVYDAFVNGTLLYWDALPTPNALIAVVGESVSELAHAPGAEKVRRSRPPRRRQPSRSQSRPSRASPITTNMSGASSRP